MRMPVSDAGSGERLAASLPNSMWLAASHMELEKVGGLRSWVGEARLRRVACRPWICGYALVRWLCVSAPAAALRHLRIMLLGGCEGSILGVAFGGRGCRIRYAACCARGCAGTHRCEGTSSPPNVWHGLHLCGVLTQSPCTLPRAPAAIRSSTASCATSSGCSRRRATTTRGPSPRRQRPRRRRPRR